MTALEAPPIPSLPPLVLEAATAAGRVNPDVLAYAIELALTGGADVDDGWWSAAACRHVGPGEYFPGHGDPWRAAVARCADCAVQGHCLAAALAGGEREGIWGGTTASGRRRIRKVLRQAGILGITGEDAYIAWTEDSPDREPPPRIRRRVVTTPWPHQAAAVAAVSHYLRDGGFCQIAMATASGKTHVGVWAATELGVDRVLVLVPSRRAHVDLWQREAELEGLKPRTITHRLVAINSFYEYCVDEEVLERSPMRGVKRPKIDRVSPTAWLNRPQLADLIEGAHDLGAYPYATIVLLALTGVRINEACTANAEGLHEVRFYPCLWVHRKGGRDQRVKLPVPVHAALREALDGRTAGPLLLTRAETRMSQSSAQRIIDRALVNVRGDHGRITPHALRHSWISAGVGAGVSLQQLAEDAGHADTRMIPYYTHSDDNPAKSANHVIAGHVMST